MKLNENMKNVAVEIFYNVITLGFIILLAYSSYEGFSLFYSGFHSVDLTVNMMILQREMQIVGTQYGIIALQNTSLTDIGSDYVERPLHFYYIDGMNMMRSSIIYFIVSGLSFLAIVALYEYRLISEILKNKK